MEQMRLEMEGHLVRYVRAYIVWSYMTMVRNQDNENSMY